ncbi:MAG TPA: hypothetical protein DEA96_04800 [Leptospiraceae bacterium]|nr:hypothetical protein [Spirochaetaceae bacterium]HBS04262.1 hypothetical protein [Leptospiraceae bacterium]|tara:strand:- start:76562 stop:76957 length:396 start_codon:yes stop_codon:yes gene_type:complete
MSGEHYANIRKVEGPFKVEYGDQVLAESNYAMELQEYHPSYEFQPVYYIPEGSINMQLFRPNQHQTSCPIKGKAAYVDLDSGSNKAEDIAWTYPSPLEGATELKGTYAFDVSKGARVLRAGEPVKSGIRKK